MIQTAAPEAWTLTRIAQSVLFFLAAAICEIGGGYLVWLWLRDGRGVALGALGGLILFLYGVLPTLQPAGLDFGRVYAAYGGVSWSSRCSGAGGSTDIGRTCRRRSAARSASLESR